MEEKHTMDDIKIELQVYTTNKSAIALYEKFGFEQESVSKKYRK